ncbi:MAG: ATP synthase F1 subunit delta, partial [SAR202 cluster bacterium]|nr:ATP synthase F1 subunit delta [SAR202 cluster bacterium]
ADAFQEFVDADRGLERAEIVSAVELTADQQKNISDALSVLIGKELTVVTRVDESLLGGFVARVGDRLIDGSIRTRFEDMRRELVRGV